MALRRIVVRIERVVLDAAVAEGRTPAELAELLKDALRDQLEDAWRDGPEEAWRHRPENARRDRPKSHQMQQRSPAHQLRERPSAHQWAPTSVDRLSASCEGPGLDAVALAASDAVGRAAALPARTRRESPGVSDGGL